MRFLECYFCGKELTNPDDYTTLPDGDLVCCKGFCIPEDEDLASPYCEVCGSCGESDCCEPLACIYKSVMLNSKCLYGETNFKEVEFQAKLGRKLFDKFQKNQKAIKIWDDLYKEIFEDV